MTDLVEYLDNKRDFLFSDLNEPRIGSDKNLLTKISPTRNVDQIRIPILLVHGRKDYIMPVLQTELMVTALSKSAKDFSVVYLPEGDHFLSRTADRLETLSTLEKFLGICLIDKKQK